MAIVTKWKEGWQSKVEERKKRDNNKKERKTYYSATLANPLHSESLASQSPQYRSQPPNYILPRQAQVTAKEKAEVTPSLPNSYSDSSKTVFPFSLFSLRLLDQREQERGYRVAIPP
jgi:hypothetical protein